MHENATASGDSNLRLMSEETTILIYLPNPSHPLKTEHNCVAIDCMCICVSSLLRGC